LLVRKILSPHTQGVAPARPGSGVRHATFSVFDHDRGTVVVPAMPSPSGPRHCGQCSAAEPTTPRECRSSAARNADFTGWQDDRRRAGVDMGPLDEAAADGLPYGR
jgi:hypothetical protein